MGDRIENQPDRGVLVRVETGPGRPGPAESDGAAGERPAGTLTGLHPQQATADEAGDGGGTVMLRGTGRRDTVGNRGGAVDRAAVRRNRRRGAALARRRGGVAGELREHRPLTGPERPAGGTLPAHEHRRHASAILGQPQPPLVTGTDRGPQERPGELDEALSLERAQAPQQAGPALGGAQVPDEPRTARQLVDEVELDRRQAGIREREAPLPRRGHLGDQLHLLEETRGQHCPDDDRQRCQVVSGDPRGQRQGQGRQERPVAPDPRRHRPDPATLRGCTRAHHDPDRLPGAVVATPERDEHCFARLQRRELGRNGVRVGALSRTGGRVDRHLDQRLAVRQRPGVGLEQRGHGIR